MQETKQQLIVCEPETAPETGFILISKGSLSWSWKIKLSQAQRDVLARRATRRAAYAFAQAMRQNPPKPRPQENVEPGRPRSAPRGGIPLDKRYVDHRPMTAAARLGSLE